jgi:hypothetical protein
MSLAAENKISEENEENGKPGIFVGSLLELGAGKDPREASRRLDQGSTHWEERDFEKPTQVISSSPGLGGAREPVQRDISRSAFLRALRTLSHLKLVGNAGLYKKIWTETTDRERCRQINRSPQVADR